MEAASTPADPAAGYPARLQIDYEEPLNRFLPLIKWLLAIPHYILLFILYFAAWFVLIWCALVVLVTRRYPPAPFYFLVGVIRWHTWVAAYLLLMTDKYPPFKLEDDPSGPIHLEIDFPEGGVDRWRPFFCWLLALPFLFVVGILADIAGIIAFFALFAILFTTGYPKGMFEIVEVSQRWTIRGWAYASFMVTRYPPFVWG